MKKIIILILASLLFLNCAHQENLTEEEREKYRRARQRYNAGQAPWIGIFKFPDLNTPPVASELLQCIQSTPSLPLSVFCLFMLSCALQVAGCEVRGDGMSGGGYREIEKLKSDFILFINPQSEIPNPKSKSIFWAPQFGCSNFEFVDNLTGILTERAPGAVWNKVF